MDIEKIKEDFSLDIEKFKSIISGTPFFDSIHYYPAISSTNAVARELSVKGYGCALVIADSQIKGRGRKNRNWFSPAGEGVYISFLVKPEFEVRDGFPFVMLGCLSVVKAIEKRYGKKAGIKWPNDIMISGKKCAGILTESAFKGGNPEFIISGIGVNVNTSAFEEGYLHPPTSLFLEFGERTEIEVFAGELVKTFSSLYIKLSSNGGNSLYNDYKRNSLCIKKSVKVVDDERIIEGIAEDIDERGCIFIRKKDGDIEKVATGDLILGNE